MFDGSGFTGDVSMWDVSKVQNFNHMFTACPGFNGNLAGWNTGSATSMQGMFVDSSFNAAVGGWDVSKVKTFREMFLRVSTFNQDISNWDVGSATSLDLMFDSATSFNQNLCNWNSALLSQKPTVSFMFDLTSCEVQSDPNVADRPLINACHPCPLVYVVSTEIVNYCGHQEHRVHKCGGNLASITSQAEQTMVENLVTSALGSLTDVWIGGAQASAFQSDDSNNQEADPAAGFEWVDGSPWFDSCSGGSCWAAGQPDNLIQLESSTGQFKGQHHIQMSSNGNWKDENGCFGFVAPKDPGVYLLPADFQDDTKYPTCSDIKGSFAGTPSSEIFRA